MKGDEEVLRPKALLFTLRIWSMDENTHAPRWRVRLQNVQSGEVHYCSDGKALIALLDELLIEFLKNEKQR